MKKFKNWFFQPQNIFLIFSLIIGIMLVFLTPIGAGFDEDTHIARIWEISRLKFIPNSLLGQGPEFPQVFYKISYRQNEIIRPVSIDFYKSNIDLKIDWDNMINHQTRAYYFPLVYFPQAFIMGFLGRVLDAPVITLYFLLRFSCLFLYIFLGYFAIKIMPFGKKLFTALAFAPMAMIQASIISPDAFSNGVSLLFIAWVFYLYYQKDKKLSKRHIYLTWLMVVLLASAKINSLPLLLLLVIIPASSFNNKKEFVKLWLGTVLITLVVCVGWNLIALLNQRNDGNAQNIFTFERLAAVKDNIKPMIQSLWMDLKIHFVQYYKEWVGVFGYGYWELPAIIYILYPVLLVIMLLSDTTNGIIQKWQRVFMAALFIVGFCFIMLIFQVLVTSNNDFSLGGIQGRYFIPLVPLLFFALLPSKPVLKFNSQNAIIALVSGLSLLGIGLIISSYLVYHVSCGSSYYQGGLCYLPKYKNWSPESNLSEPLQYGQVYDQTFLFECSPVKEIRVWIDPKEHNLDGELSISLTGSDSGENILLEKIGVSDLEKAGWLIIPVSDFYPTLNTPYHFSIRENGIQDDAQLGLSLRDEYKEGILMIDGKPVDYDLLFEYGCSR